MIHSFSIMDPPVSSTATEELKQEIKDKIPENEKKVPESLKISFPPIEEEILPRKSGRGSLIVLPNTETERMSIESLSDSVVCLLEYWLDISKEKQKNHQKCYEYYHRLERVFGTILTIFSFVSGTLSGTTFSLDVSILKWMTLSACILSMFAGIVSALDKQYGFSSLASEHNKSARAYSKLIERIEMKLHVRQIMSSKDQLFKTMNEINTAIDTLISSEPTIESQIVQIYPYSKEYDDLLIEQLMKKYEELPEELKNVLKMQSKLEPKVISKEIILPPKKKRCCC